MGPASIGMFMPASITGVPLSGPELFAGFGLQAAPSVNITKTTTALHHVDFIMRPPYSHGPMSVEGGMLTRSVSPLAMRVCGTFPHRTWEAG
jgi:hypothetical protein